MKNIHWESVWRIQSEKKLWAFSFIFVYFGVVVVVLFMDLYIPLHDWHLSAVSRLLKKCRSYIGRVLYQGTGTGTLLSVFKGLWLYEIIVTDTRVGSSLVAFVTSSPSILQSLLGDTQHAFTDPLSNGNIGLSVENNQLYKCKSFWKVLKTQWPKKKKRASNSKFK